MALKAALLALACLGAPAAGLAQVTGSIVAAPTLNDGQRAFRAGHFEDARRIWSALATSGDPVTFAQAAFHLGLLFDLGNGIAADPAEAYRWYLLAAQRGLPEAEFNVAVMNDSGAAGPRNLAEAATWYARAAANGHRRAQYNLAHLYDAGEGVPQNHDVAAAWLRAAAHQKLPAAAAELGHIRPSDFSVAPGGSGLVAPVPVLPADGDTLDLSHAVSRSVEFAWIAPAQPTQVRFFLELVSVEKDQVKDVFADYVDPTARAIALRDPRGHYLWRVYAVGEVTGQTDYAASAWRAFDQH